MPYMIIGGGIRLIDLNSLSIDFAETAYFNSSTWNQAWNQTVTASVVAYSSPHVFYSNGGTSPKVVKTSATGLGWSPHNLEIRSEEFDNAAWTKQGGTTITANNTTAPDGASTADKATDAGGADSIVTATAVTLVSGFSYTSSVYLKNNSGVQWIRFISDETGGPTNGNTIWFDIQNGVVGTQQTNGSGWTLISATITAIGDGWYLCSIAQTVGGTAGKWKIHSATADSSTTRTSGSYFIWGAQRNRGIVPTAYIVTTSAAKYGLPISYGEGLLVEPAATNLCLRSDDLTNASWSKTTMSTAKTAIGPDSASNSATTLTATAANATATQAITSGSAARVTHCWIKRRTGTGNIDLTQDNGSNWFTQSVTSTWTRFELATVTSANPTVGIRIVTSGDEVDVWGFQHETGTIGTSTIPSLGSTVTRATDAVNVATSSYPHSDAVGTMIVSVTPRLADASATNRLWELSNGTAIEKHDVQLVTGDTPDSFGFEVTAGGLPQVIAATTKAGSQSTSGNKVAAFWSANDSGILIDAGSQVQDTSCAMPTVTSLQLGYSTATASRELNGFIKSLFFVPRRMSEAEMQAKTT